MAYNIDSNGRSEWHSCSLCNCLMQLLEDQPSLALFLGAKNIQRRGLQCANCGRLLCQACSQNDGFWCSCGSNAWVALPYLRDAAAEQGVPPSMDSAHATPLQRETV